MKMSSLLCVLFFALPSFATNPQIRVCKLTGGVFHSIRTSDDEIGFCQYKSALIDAVSILETTSNEPKSAAVEAFESSPIANCLEAQATSVKGEDVEGRSFDLCVFDDGSSIGRETLMSGKNSADNADLVKALKIRF
jgi:hypothetical protein